MKRTLFFYPLTIGAFLALILFIQDRGQTLVPDAGGDPAVLMDIHSKPAAQDNRSNVDSSFTDQLRESLRHPLSLLLLQIVVIMIFARLFGIAFQRLGQPSVVGEIIAGIALGPSLLGSLWPACHSFIFPADSLKTLQFLSQIGLAFFMFIVGLEFEPAKLRRRTDAALAISHAGIVVPFCLGVFLSYFIFRSFAPAGVDFRSFSLFLGIAMSITAFPVLARIIRERGMTHTPLGTLVITCAAIDDVSAWCILATVIALVKAGGVASSIVPLGLAAAFGGLMLFVIRPWLHRFGERLKPDEHLGRNALAIALFVLLVSAYIAEVIGIHALFGAFLAGVIMPRHEHLLDELRQKIEDVSVVLLLPIFFAFTGVRTRIGLLDSLELWIVCVIVIAVAVAGKFAGTALTARFTGQTWRDSLAVGALMNTRGLMELVVLNIGYDLGILSQTLFAIMVLMALSTTLMTGPLLNLIEYGTILPPFRRKQVQ